MRREQSEKQRRKKELNRGLTLSPDLLLSQGATGERSARVQEQSCPKEGPRGGGDGRGPRGSKRCVSRTARGESPLKEWTDGARGQPDALSSTHCCARHSRAPVNQDEEGG